MKQKNIATWLKVVTIAVALLGIAFFGSATAYAYFYKPDYGDSVPIYLRQNIIFIWVTALLCFSILFFFWRIVSEIANDNSFSMENVKNFKCMGVCGVLIILEYVIRIIVWLVKGDIVFITLSYTLLKIIVFIIFVILCIAMSKLVKNAYDIKQENELTI